MYPNFRNFMSAYPNDRLLGINQFQYNYSYFLIPRTTRLVYLEKKVIWATVAKRTVD